MDAFEQITEKFVDQGIQKGDDHFLINNSIESFLKAFTVENTSDHINYDLKNHRSLQKWIQNA